MLDPTPDPVNPSAGRRRPTRTAPTVSVQNTQRTPSDGRSATPNFPPPPIDRDPLAARAVPTLVLVPGGSTRSGRGAVGTREPDATFHDHEPSEDDLRHRRHRAGGQPRRRGGAASRAPRPRLGPRHQRRPPARPLGRREGRRRPRRRRRPPPRRRGGRLGPQLRRQGRRLGHPGGVSRAERRGVPPPARRRGRRGRGAVRPRRARWASTRRATTSAPTRRPPRRPTRSMLTPARRSRPRRWRWSTSSGAGCR